MTDTDHFRDEVDRLDSGLPDVPDLHRIRAAGSRRRRRRRQGGVLAGGALAVALVTPAVLLAGGDGTARVDDGSAATRPDSSAPASPSPRLADRSFGEGMRAATSEVFPEAGFRSERLGDRWVWADHTTIDSRVGDPPRWETLFSWAQYHDLAGVDSLYVLAERTSPSPVVDPAGEGHCEAGLYAVEKECRVWQSGGRTVVLHDGTRSRGQEAGRWNRDIEVWGADGTRTLEARTSVGVVATGETWPEAEARMPDVDDLVALALDERLVLPEPERYPDDYPPNRPARP